MKKILIIDDEEIILKSFSRLLSKAGYHTVLSRSGLDAIVKVSRNVFDVILCDIRMPGISGIDTLIKLKQVWSLRQSKVPPIIAMSGDYQPENDERIQEIAPCAYLLKPFGAEELLNCIQTALDPETKSKPALIE